MGNSWTDRIVGDRMKVDQEFQRRVEQSQFSRQQWGLIMTAVEFDVENADDADDARVVADTSSLPHVIPELDNVEAQMGAMGGTPDRSGGGGLFSGLLDALGIGGGDGGDDERLEAAEELTQEYADALQSHLEEQGKWERVRQSVAEDQPSPE